MRYRASTSLRVSHSRGPSPDRRRQHPSASSAPHTACWLLWQALQATMCCFAGAAAPPSLVRAESEAADFSFPAFASSWPDTMAPVNTCSQVNRPVTAARRNSAARRPCVRQGRLNARSSGCCTTRLSTGWGTAGSAQSTNVVLTSSGGCTAGATVDRSARRPARTPTSMASMPAGLGSREIAAAGQVTGLGSWRLPEDMFRGCSESKCRPGLHDAPPVNVLAPRLRARTPPYRWPGPPLTSEQYSDDCGCT